MHSFSKIAGIRSVAIMLAIVLTVFGTRTLKASPHCSSCNACSEKAQSCNACQNVQLVPAACGTCVASCKDQEHARHEAAEDRARAEQAQKDADEKAADYRAKADQAEQEGAKKAAEYQAKANAHLEKAGLLCPTGSIAPAQ